MLASQPHVLVHLVARGDHRLVGVCRCWQVTVHVRVVGWVVVNEAVSVAVAESLVVPRVEQEGVPADVNQCARRPCTLVGGAEVQELESGIEDSVSGLAVEVLIYLNAVGQPLMQAAWYQSSDDVHHLPFYWVRARKQIRTPSNSLSG